MTKLSIRALWLCTALGALAACGTSGGGPRPSPSPSPSPSPTPNPDAPTISAFSASRTTVGPGERVTLTWTTQKAKSIVITAEPGGEVTRSDAGAGSVMSTPITANTTFVLKATNDAGDTTQRVTVQLATGPVPTITNFTATPERVPEDGETIFRWTTQNSTRLELRGPGDRVLVRTSTTNVATGEYRLSPAVSGTYRLQAFDAGAGMTEATVVVRVDAPARILLFRVRPTSVPAFPATVSVNYQVEGSVLTELLVNGAAAPSFTGADTGTVTVDLMGTSRIELRVTGGDGNVGYVSELVSQATAEQEPNEDIDAATPITSGASGAFGTADDVDVYAITVPAGGTVFAQTSDGQGRCAVDTLVQLLDATGEALAENDDGGAPIPGTRAGCSLLDPQQDSALTDLAAGTYYLRVTAFQGDTGSYTLSVQVSPPSCGDGFIQASRMERCDDANATAGDGCSATCTYELAGNVTGTQPQTFQGSTTPTRAYLTYGVTLGSPGYIAVDTGVPAIGSCTGAQVAVGIEDPQGRIISVSQPTPGEPCASLAPAAPPLAAGSYVVLVVTDAPVAALEVRIRVSGVACGNGIVEAGEVCDDNNTAAGDGCSATCTLETQGTIMGPPGDQTFMTAVAAGQQLAYRVVLAQPATVIAEAFAGPLGTTCDTTSDLFLDLLDASGRRVESNDDGGPGSCPLLIAPRTSSSAVSLPAGTYSLVLRGFNAMVAVPSATLRVRVLTPGCGDTIVRSAEECDDGNTTNGDGCSSSCRLEPRATLSGPPLNQSYTNVSLSPGNPASYTLNVSRLSVLRVETGFGTLGMGCTVGSGISIELRDSAGQALGGSDLAESNDCAILDATTATTAGQLASGRYSIVFRSSATTPVTNLAVRISLTAAACGDGILHAGEQCDDANTRNGDGCSSTCRLEASVVMETEPNNTRQTANIVMLTRGSTVTVTGGIAAPGSDLDTFGFDVPAGAAARLTARTFTTLGQPTSCTMAADTVIRLLSSTGTELALDDDTNGVCSEILSTGLMPGRYFLEVGGYSASTTIPVYYLSLYVR